MTNNYTCRGFLGLSAAAVAAGLAACTGGAPHRLLDAHKTIPVDC
jgi:hypothetical protein